LLLRNEIFVNGVGNGAKPILIMSLVFEQEAVELFGGKGRSGLEGLDILQRDCVEGGLGIGGDGVGELDEFVEVGVGDFEVVKFAFEGFDGVEHRCDGINE
jgi:hypothetical protein